MNNYTNTDTTTPYISYRPACDTETKICHYISKMITNMSMHQSRRHASYSACTYMTCTKQLGDDDNGYFCLVARIAAFTAPIPLRLIASC
jgi:hypothetical protein